MAQMHLGPMRIVLVASPASIEKILRERPNNFKRSLNVEKVFKDSNVNGLFSMEGDEWRHSRAWLFPQFAPGKINKTSALIAKHATELRKALDAYSTETEMLQKKWFHLEQPDANARYTQSNSYNPTELKSTIDVFSSYAFGVVVDFAFAHGM
jgi:cytochrome P450